MIYQVSIPSNSEIFGDRVVSVQIDTENNLVKISGKFSKIDESERTISLSAQTLNTIMPFLCNAQAALNSKRMPDYKSRESIVSTVPEPPCMRDDWQNDEPEELTGDEMLDLLFSYVYRAIK